MVGTVGAYLAVYNSIQLIGWSCVLYLTIVPQSVGLMNKRELILGIVQTLALMEVVHASLRIVRSSPLITAIQIASRLFILYGVMYSYPEVKVHTNFVNMMIVSWSLADITRYLYYSLYTFIGRLHLLAFLRYNLFLVLYPTGIMGEVVLIWYSLPCAVRKPLFDFSLPNPLNFGFNTYELYLILLLLYIPGAPVMYGHMLAQRRKIMNQKIKVA